MQIPLKQLKSLLKTLEEGGASEFEYQDEKYRLRLSLGRGAVAGATTPPAAHASVRAEAAAGGAALSTEEADIVYLTSPFVGTFYRAAAPEAEHFVQVGSRVTRGQTLCIVEAMKLMNEIEAEFAGTILEVLVENGQSVEFGQRLFKMKKD
jgi:acetyl-CoA carboxylase biotin carboxyl carrier protein